MDICLWNKCNNRCVMCTNPKDFWESDIYTKDFLEKRLLELGSKLKDNDSILLTGGEPTIHPQFLEVLKFICAKYPGHRIDLLSNGRRFYYKDFAAEIMKTPNLAVAIPLHGYNSRTHEAITRASGSFDQAVAGIKNLLAFRNSKLNQKVEIRVVVSSFNYKHIGKILELLKKELDSADRVVLIFLEVEGQGFDNFDKVGIKYDIFAAYLPAIRPYIKKFKEFRLYHFPLCVLPVDFWPFAWRTLPIEETSFLPGCEKCLYKEFCLGVHRGYLDKVGGDEFKPITKKVKISRTGDFYHPIADCEI